MIAACGLTLLVGCAQEFKYDLWESWNGFMPGTCVQMEMGSPEMTTKITKSIDRKGDAEIVLKTLTTVAGSEFQGEEKIEKPADGASGGVPCAMCSKTHKTDAGSWTTDKVKLGEAEKMCAVYEGKLYDCSDAESGSTKVWYCEDVPGWIVKCESNFGGFESKMRVVSYEKK